MEDGTANDAAFGPMGDAPQQSPIMRLQALLNMRGFGPLVVSGQLDAPTKAAMERAKVGTDVQGAITLLEAPPVTGAAPSVPWFKQPKFIFGGLAVLGVVGYIAYRTGYFDDELDAQGSAEPNQPPLVPVQGLAEPVKVTKPRRPKREKCDVGPPDDVIEGELITPPEA